MREIMHQKPVRDPFLILVNNPKQPVHARNCLKLRYFEEDYQKALKKLTLFFLSNPISFNEQVMKNKRGLKLVTSHRSRYKTSSDKFLD